MNKRSTSRVGLLPFGFFISRLSKFLNPQSARSSTTTIPCRWYSGLMYMLREIGGGREDRGKMFETNGRSA